MDIYTSKSQREHGVKGKNRILRQSSGGKGLWWVWKAPCLTPYTERERVSGK